MGNLPNVYANKIEKKIDNSQEYVTVKEHEERFFTKNDIEKKINNIFKNNEYIYKIRVSIETDKGIEEKVIVGKTKNKLITMNNELIDIDSIKNIYVK